MLSHDFWRWKKACTCVAREEREKKSNVAIHMTPNVRGKRATTAGRQARAMQDKPQQRAGSVACRCRSA